ncbi:MAG: hypothetical protein L6M37_03380, partial [Candidatus Methylarchaceae archaeon HK02M1]|nr:hypothetical protein [Candidatus Methylarchaceae archaeon HK02M1]
YFRQFNEMIVTDDIASKFSTTLKSTLEIRIDPNSAQGRKTSEWEFRVVINRLLGTLDWGTIFVFKIIF